MLVGRLPGLQPPPLRRPAASRRSEPERQFRFAARGLSLRSVFLEIAAGDCPVARCAAGHVERAYAAGAPEALADVRAPNLVPLASDGVLVPLPEGSVDAALSSHLIERLHPRDVLEHLQNVRRALRRGGRYFCITAHRFRAQGPRQFCFSAQGLRELMEEAGYRRVRFYARLGAVYGEVPYWLLHAAEGFLARLPARLRAGLARKAAAHALLGLYAEAVK